MILTAGLGTRLKPITNSIPKALVPVAGIPMLELCLEYLKKHGVDEFIINVHHLADQLMEYTAKKRWEGYNIEISDETDMLMNTGGGLNKAAALLSEGDDFVLMAVDVLTNLNLKSMWEEHKNQGALVSLAVKSRETSRGLLFDSNGCLAGWRNNATGEEKSVSGRTPKLAYGFSGVHIVNPAIFDLIKEKGAFSIIDLYLRLAQTEKIKAFDHSSGDWMEFGRVENIENIDKNKTFLSILEEIDIKLPTN